MVTRRTLLAVGAGSVAAVSGCLGGGNDRTNDGEDEDDSSEVSSEDGSGTVSTDDERAEPSYSLSAAPVEANDGLDPVLSTDDETVAEFEPLVDLIEEVTTVFETIHRPISAADAERFRTITADVEPHFGGNPPGYYFGHEGRRVSVTLRGG